MPQTLSYEPFRVCCRAEVKSIKSSHHVCREVWRATEGKVLKAAPYMKKESKDYDKYAVGVYKENLLVRHIPIEISSLCFHFLNHKVENNIKAFITGKSHREIGLVVLAKLMFLTDDSRCCETLENQLTKRRNIFSNVDLKKRCV